MTEDTSQEATQTEAKAEVVSESTPAQQTESKWSYADGVNGDGDVPEWFKSDKYKSVADQAKAYKDLESKLGGFTGSPEAYDINISDGLKELGIEGIDESDPSLVGFMEIAKNAGMNQEIFDTVIEHYMMSEIAKQNAATELETKRLADETKALGPNAESRLSNLDAWAKKNLPEDLYEPFVGLGKDAKSIQAIEQIVSMTRNAPVNPKDVKAVPGITEAEIKEMQFAKDDRGNRRMQTDSAYRKEVEQKMREFYGEENHRIVIGGS